METQATSNAFYNDYIVQHSQDHFKLSEEQIVKAVRRHQREHPSRIKMSATSTPHETAQVTNRFAD